MTQQLLSYIRCNKTNIDKVIFEPKYFSDRSPALQLNATIKILDGTTIEFATGLAPYSRHSEWQTLIFFEHLLQDMPIEKYHCIIDKIDNEQDQIALPLKANWKSLFAKFRAADIEHSFLYEWELYIFKPQIK